MEENSSQAASATPRDFQQLQWDLNLEDDCRQLVLLAVREDLSRSYDLTTVSLVEDSSFGSAHVVAREEGVVAGLICVPTILATMQFEAEWTPACEDGDRVQPGQLLATLQARSRDLLTSERILLNFIGRLSGIATLTRQHVDEIQGTAAQVYDTRKTTPGWRRLEKYAVGCGGGRNHRTGLYDAVLIKDNHLAHSAGSDGQPLRPAAAVEQARRFLAEMYASTGGELPLIEVEVDTLAQLENVLPQAPDLVLLDNMTPQQLAEAVRLRDELAPRVQLEASGGIQLSSLRQVAQTGVDRISVGALTHSALGFDVGLDWETPESIL